MSNDQYSVENLISRKKRRKNREKLSEDLEKLFAELQNNSNDTSEQTSNASGTPVGTPDDKEKREAIDVKEAVNTAQKYLDRESSDRLAQIFNDDEDSANEATYRFFQKRAQPLPSPGLPPGILTFEMIPMKKVVYNKIFELSNSYLGKRQLLSSRWLYHYHRRGWNYPSALYCWLFQIAAYDSDSSLRDNASCTLSSLWRSLSLEAVTKGAQSIIPNNRCIPWQEFEKAIMNYGALEARISWARQLVQSEDMDQSEGSNLATIDMENNSVGVSSIPIGNLRSIIQLFGKSVWHNKSSYGVDTLNYIIVLLIQISMDQHCDQLAYDIERCIGCCLEAYHPSAWRKELEALASFMANQFIEEELQLKTLGPLKSVSERSDFFRRILATTYLLNGSARAETLSRSKLQSPATPNSPQSTISEDITSSNGSTPIVVESSDALYPISIEAQLEPLVRTHKMIGFRSRQLNVHKLSCVIHLLSTALGDDEEEFKQQRASVESIIRSLQHLSKKIGGKIGSLDRIIVSNVQKPIIEDLLNYAKYRKIRLEKRDIKSGVRQKRLTKTFFDQVGHFTHSPLQMSHVREYLYKFLVVGDLGTGKTSIIKRYVHNIFSMHYKSTIGVDFALKVIQWSPEIVVRLQLWDIAGQERFGNMTRVYYKEALGAFVVYDVTRPQTFEGVRKWKADLDSKISLPEAWGGGHIPVVLLANKSDLINEGHGQHVNASEMDAFCNENGFVKWFETSAKDNTNIDEAARHLVSSILAIEQEHLDRHDADGFEGNNQNIRIDQDKTRNDSGCC